MKATLKLLSVFVFTLVIGSESFATGPTKTSKQLKPEITDSRVSIGGGSDAPVTIVEYSDFQCYYCSKGNSILKKVIEKYGDKVRVVFKHLPFQSIPAALYFEAIALQDKTKAIAFREKVFKNQSSFRSEGEEFLKNTAKEVGADLAQVLKDIENQKLKDLIASDVKEATKFGIRGTPGFLVNGVFVRGAKPASYFSKIIDKQLEK